MILIVAVGTVGGYSGVASAASHSQSTMRTSGDMCSGTNGSGMACGVTTAGSNSAQLKNNTAQYQKVSGIIRIATLFALGGVWLSVVMFLRSRKKNFVYVVLVSVFYVYLYKVIDYTLLQYQSLLVLKHFVPDLMLNGIQHGNSINLVPLISLTAGDIQTSLLNILLFIPFGVGLPFITNWYKKHVLVAGVLLSIGIELLQLLTGLLGHITFRVADINDVLFNTLGTMVGYLLCIGIVRVVRRAYAGNNKLSANSLVSYIIERPQV